MRINNRKVPFERKSAAALKYKKSEDLAPRLIAKGLGNVAEKIIEAAIKTGIPIHEDPDLVKLLMSLNIDEVIPVELYEVVAEVFAFIYRMNNRAILNK